MRAEVIAIGDELTSGERLDTNTQWISKQLTDIGLEVMFHTTVGDDLAANIDVFQAAIERADVVVCTGGLGPTADDLTRDAIAAALRVPLVRDEESLEHICSLFTKRGRQMPERNERQADFPQGAASIFNPNGTAPGIHAQATKAAGGSCHLFALPGVPAEMHEMYTATVAPAVLSLIGEPRVIRHRAIKIFGPGESQLESMLPDLIARGREPRVGITASGATLTLRITASGPDEASCLAAMEPTAQQIYDAVGKYVFGEGEIDLHHATQQLLAENNATLATDECFTRGLVASWMAEDELAERTFTGGQLSWTMSDVAQAASDVRERLGSTYGLAIGPPMATEQVTVAVADERRVVTEDFKLGGHPAVVGPRIAKCALNLLRRAIIGDA
ncbi:competence/damage-inducible protein A [Aeoliella mucimassa]|uniref:CinA-like protein n=1 Tax=Aeoliella mucimassa TaxID=2527972 RepID=A0A518AR38_9BACT|nr:CinA family nicotinamide mononucleotide deamidase-related protein [Aeoliella mucimassa]QDU57187.1 Putative competence-damage inducible protein [Aeoliella mucimassa]